MNMRIITGSAKGIQLKAPTGLSTRPTTDRVKESLFGILGYLVEDARVMDVFAGTGNLSLEALSRGAASAIAVDKSANCVRIIRENAAKTRLEDRLTALKGDGLRYLTQYAEEGRMFDLIFADPPYEQGFIAKVLAAVEGGEVLADGGVLIAEHTKKEPIDETMLNKLEIRRQERYGETIVSFLMHKKEAKES